MYSQVFSDSLSRSVVIPFTIKVEWPITNPFWWLLVYIQICIFLFGLVLVFLFNWFIFDSFPMQIDYSDNLSRIIIECISTFASGDYLYISKSTKKLSIGGFVDVLCFYYYYLCYYLCLWTCFIIHCSVQNEKFRRMWNSQRH